MKVKPESIKKHKIFFVPECFPLEGGSIAKPAASAMDFLQGLADQGTVELFLIAGQKEEKAMPKIKSLGIEKYFFGANRFFVTDEYIHGKAEADRDRHISQLGKNQDFVDEYFKQVKLAELALAGRISRENAFLIGRDVWFDAFYTARFSGIDFALVRETLSEKGLNAESICPWVNKISVCKPDLRRVLLGKMPPQDYKKIEAHVFSSLRKELLGGVDFSGLVKKLAERNSKNQLGAMPPA